MRLIILPYLLLSLAVSVGWGEDAGFAPGQLIVKLRESARGQPGLAQAGSVKNTGISELDSLSRVWRVEGWCRLVSTPDSRCDLLYLLSMDPSSDVAAAVADFGRAAAVEYACPNVRLPLFGKPADPPDDPRYPEQWALPKIRAPRAWETCHGDSTVVIAVIDDGAAWTHEDLSANLWVNPAEDINGNGRFDTLPPPDGDLDGVDQDGNRCVDDVIGYDFYRGDPNPMSGPSDSHGTLCLGAANAVTGNGIGIASPAWNVQAMVLRCGGGGSVYLSAAISAVYYAIYMNASVVSVGWGTQSSYPPLRDAFEDLSESGAVTAAAAGTGGVVYPAAYPGIIAVTASDSGDRRASFAAYGDWIDVCAPGVQILSTVPGGYEYYDGPSLSASIVAAVLAWYRSAQPGITADSARTLLYSLCDSMPDPLYVQGLLGHGRVAMADSEPSDVGERPGDVRVTRFEGAGIVCGVLDLSGLEAQTAERGGIVSRVCLLDAAGRRALDLHPGANDVRALAPGVYFIAQGSGTRGQVPGRIRKVVITR